MSSPRIRIHGARQHNLKGLDLELPLGELIVVTGVSGSGKSSLVFDTIYAEGQRRYVETFSAYARQFLERMDKPQVDRIEGIPPAIAIDQVNPVRTSRSTVGTMTELNDHLKLLFARAARLYCHGCGREVRRDTPETMAAEILARLAGKRTLVTFEVRVPENFSTTEVREALAAQGYTRMHAERAGSFEVIQDRIVPRPDARERLIEDLEAASRHGRGRVAVYPADAQGRAAAPLRFSTDLHCPDCDIHYEDPGPGLFSFNSPVGACPVCRGFGRVIGIDDALVVPDADRTLAGGAVKPFQSKSYIECQGDLMRYARRAGVPTDVPWRDLGERHRRWVMEGEGDFDRKVWYGVHRFFRWLESKSYKMHIRVLLSRYRAYTECPACAGARLKPEALDWRIGSRAEAAAVCDEQARHWPANNRLDARARALVPGLCVHDVVRLPIARAREFFGHLRLAAPFDEATKTLLEQVRARFDYLVTVGLGYLTLDRQSRTLSGGEVQRINLTTALGTSLVNTLFVLDEPSIGLHPRDIDRVTAVLGRLRDAGNTLLVVEHDPQVMLAADRLLDLGPGPGERGGEIVAFDRPDRVARARKSLTGAYLSGRRQVGRVRTPRAPAARGPWLTVRGAAEHNLRDVDARFPLNRLVCVTGVSGSGKSTLIEHVLYRALLRARGRPTDAPGRHRAIEGADSIAQVVLVDQSAIGRTARSNPASYVGAFDAIRKLFAAQPLARARGYTTGTFSFNAGHGRCPVCLGSGFEHVEMQFLSDVYLRCAECDGRRYRAEVLEVKYGGADGAERSVADVLAMTVHEALAFFSDRPDVVAALAPIRGVGLEYLRLGQPVPTLSGGEAQRLKLAGHLAQAARKDQGHTLFLFDEPTTGLHFADIERLLGAFDALLARGDSLIVIEHNLDVIAAADWIVDLGPEGGEGGGSVVAQGTPGEIAAARASHTGKALRAHGRAPARPDAASARPRRKSSNAIEIHHAREHNLRNVDVRVPRDEFTVITGVSGSGKSTLAFDVLFREGQRRYLESLNAYARSIVQPASRPEVDEILGIPPTVAIEQRTSRGGRKSTVGTATEIHHYLRLLYVKLGEQHCPDCGTPIRPQSRESCLARIARGFRGRKVTLLAPLVVHRKGYYTELARWAHARGFAQLRVDGAMVPTDPWPRLSRFQEHDIELPLGEIRVEPRAERELLALLDRALALGNGVVHVAPSGRGAEVILSTRRACAGCGRSFHEPDPRLFSYNSRHGWCESCYGTGVRLTREEAKQLAEDPAGGDVGGEDGQACPACAGRRLNPEALAVRFRDRSIAELSALPVDEALRFFSRLRLDARSRAIARDLLPEIVARLRFLSQVGLSYLALDRAAPTLSGGEAQRIRLAASLGSNLRGVCYVLDEPTIGLHARDNRMLLETLERLRAAGNTVVVVEHDEETIRRAGHVIDLGPGAGVHGGKVVAEGRVAALKRNPASVTGRYLRARRRQSDEPRRPVRRDTAQLRIRGANLHNLRNVDAAIPLGRLVCVTGVSGSGKSTLVRDVLRANLEQLAGRRRGKPVFSGCASIDGHEAIGRVLEVDQAPIGKTPRSCPATYVGFWDDIRRLFAATGESRLRGYDAGRFSFNTAGGRCATCEGQGFRRVEMSFLPDVRVPCETCGGARFDAATLEVLYRGRNIAQVLAMSVEEATEFFTAHERVHRALALLGEVGLGYLTLGQHSPTLSGGEAQRIKLVTELARARPQTARGRASGATLYVLDEPTIGLHMADVEKLIGALHRLVDAGNSVVVIEHNLDVIAEADWVIDLGPEGGAGGGRIVARGTPAAVAARAARSQTGRFLAPMFAPPRRRR